MVGRGALPMPWEETCIMDERMIFVSECLSGELSMTALCERHGISRKTGYKWLGRYQADPTEGFADRSRAPLHRPGGVEASVVDAIVELRQQRPSWGPRKLRAKLEWLAPERVWPAASTIGDVLKREGLVSERRRRHRAMPVSAPFREVTGPNDVWSADFKGWFRTIDGRRCDPLTISDAHSRYLLACQIVEPSIEGVRPCFERVFHEFGLPHSLRTDNGAPFASDGVGGLTRLSVTWVKLGIKLELIDPGAPQQNGRHERMHRTLKAETTSPPAGTGGQQQRRFNRFRHDYNHERPHEALGQEPPAAHYQPSPRPYPTRVLEPWYDANHAVRRVRTSGEIKWGGERIFLGAALAGEPVGIAETENGNWIVRFADIDLGVIDRTTKKLRRFAPPRPGRRKAEHMGKTVTHVAGP